MKNKDPCKPYACRIQACLNDNKFRESACQDVIESMRDCCRKWGDKSFVCQGMLKTEPETKSTKPADKL